MKKTSGGQSLRQAATRLTLCCGAAVVAVLSAVGPAHATHFRAAHIDWKHVGPAANHDIEFTIQSAWRQNGVSSGSGYRCVYPADYVNPTTQMPTRPCTGPVVGGQIQPGVGDVFVEAVGSTRFDFGDSTSFGSPGNSSQALLYLVTSADAAANWVFGLALDYRSFPTLDTTIEHHYADGTVRIAKIDAGNRISGCTVPNAHLNNPDTGYRVQTTVDVADANSSPTTSLPPVIPCPINGICTFPVTVSDNETDPVTFRMSTTSEAAITSQPGPPQCTNAATITTTNATTGQYTWDTTGCRLASSAGPAPPAGGCANGALNTLYSTQIMIAEPGKGTLTPVDFFIQLVPACSLNDPPAFDHPPTPACGSTVSAHPNTPVSISLQASDPNSGNVTLNAAGVPAGATFVPPLPAAANPVSSMFSWTPGVGDIGQHTVTFTATDPCSLQQLCSITFDVSQEICGNTIDDDGDTFVDCADDDCNGTTCNDNDACTQTDTCQNGTCTGGNPVTCSASDQCHDVGTCNPGTGLCSDPAKPNGTTCTDGDACTQTDTCQGGACIGGNSVTCTASDQCHNAGTCDPGTGTCSNPAKMDGTACTDGNGCTQTDTCLGGTCTPGSPVVCTASDQCHDAGTCNPGDGMCSNPAKPNGTTCSDGDACTQTDTCQGGACDGANPVTCTPSDQCHDVGTCDPGTGMCSNPAKPNGTTCSDGDACTQTDTCQGGACDGANPVTCTASDQCHNAGTCNPETGMCSNPAKPDGTTCSDGDACTQTDTCQGGACDGANPVTCTPSDQCHNAGTCDPGTGMCSDPAKPNGTTCTDGDACTQTDTCQGGACSGANPVTCTASDQCHTAGTCDPGTGMCSNPALANGTGCNDNDACTQTDTCQNGSCNGGNAVVCTPLDQCHAAGTCNPGTGLCSNPSSTNGTPCDDGNGCTLNDTCQNGQCTSGSGMCTPTPTPPPTITPTLPATPTETATPLPVCGNGVVESGEECDQGNSNCAPGTCCASSCGSTCQVLGQCTGSMGCCASAADCPAGEGCCGDGVLEGAEQCDDGNTLDGDCCSSVCQHEPAPCVPLPVICQGLAVTNVIYNPTWRLSLLKDTSPADGVLDRWVARGDFSLPDDVDIDPDTEVVHFILNQNDGSNASTELYHPTLSSGRFHPRKNRIGLDIGWRFQLSNAEVELAEAPGCRRFTIRRIPRVNFFKFKVGGFNASVPAPQPVASSRSVRQTIVVGDVCVTRLLDCAPKNARTLRYRCRPALCGNGTIDPHEECGESTLAACDPGMTCDTCRCVQP